MSPQTETDIIRKVISILSATEKSASRYSAEISRLKERERYVREGTYRLGLIGITSSGKSTLVNTLLGEELLHAEASPTTNVIVTCRHGKQLKCNVYFHNGRVISAARDDVKGCLEQCGSLREV